MTLLLGRRFGLQRHYSLDAGSDSSDITPWTRVRTPAALLLGRGFGLQRHYSLDAGSDSSDAIYNFIGV
ncbi:hypothetical protein [Paenibacillus sp. FSL L8-0708]|uniref:hypothetical protein n=1 Tax=Paenibacillus sp. FSL L8-0708 TaxID=2975311 RepID=UPI0030F5DC43